ncbi:MAG: nucleotidyltransferase domain-containing protein [Candidatus Aenigmarchaeota archaeon]|nr:nucleotidyltransferase domain-containing protein [Candidatus Aenigmarchaeota archaeon]
MKIKTIPKKKSIKDIARKRRADMVKVLTQKILDKFGKYVKCVVLVGSVARDEFRSNSDIDMFLVIDDTKVNFTPEEKRRIDVEIDIAAQEINKDIIVQPAYTLTEFWDMVRTSHPLIYNFIRDGIPVYDTGFFMPIKRLLELGRIPATKEAADALLDKAPKRLRRINEVKLYMVAEDCYYSMLDMTQAVLMSLGFAPPSPGRAAEEFRKHLVDTKIIDGKYADWLDAINQFRKDVEHKKINEIKGADLDEWVKKADEFVNKMLQIADALELKKKERIVEKSYDVMTKAISAALKSVNKLPNDAAEITNAFKKYLIDEGLVERHYADIFEHLGEMRKMVRDGKIKELSDKEIYSNREYVRKFIHHIGKIVKDEEPEQ